MPKVGYTQAQEDILFFFLDKYDGNEHYGEILDLTVKEFRPFSTGIKTIIRDKYGEGIEDYFAFFKNLCKETGVPLEMFGSLNTIKSWFGIGTKSDVRPRRNDDGRKKMFAIAFALRLTIEETANLFHKVYFDRAFNQRKYEELIYYFCISKGFSYKTAEDMINQVDMRLASLDDKTILTKAIVKEADQLETEQDLLDYIYAHGHNFALDMQGAKVVFSNIKARALKEAQQVAKAYMDALEHSDKENYHDARAMHNPAMVSNGDNYSDGFLYAAITNQRNAQTKEDLAARRAEGKKSVSKELSFTNAYLSQEITRNFPQASSLKDGGSSFEEIRKTIILLFSYQYWCKAARQKDENIYDDYVDELNDALDEANLAPLYYGNPYDWLFLYCTASVNPLDVFHGILAEALYESGDI